ncbi:hypothetical protein [Propioniciclava flava]
MTMNVISKTSVTDKMSVTTGMGRWPSMNGPNASSKTVMIG